LEGALALDELGDGVDGVEVFDIEVFVFDSHAEFVFDKLDQLHRKERIHQPKRKDVFVILKIVISQHALQKASNSDLIFFCRHVSQAAGGE
jgi:hypothetical protein